MTTYYQAPDVTLLHGDVRAVLSSLEPESVHCTVCSPPYLGLRRYLPEGHPDEAKQIGLEASVEEYVQVLVEVFRGVWRVLRADGTLWLNLGSSYAGGGHGPTGEGSCIGDTEYETRQGFVNRRTTDCRGFKPKDLILTPFFVAEALRQDGWYLRSDIIWHKPNPMPESVTDRPTTSHEHIFLLAKSDTYYFDQEAVRERSVSPEQEAHNQRYAKVYSAFDEKAHNRQPNNTNHLGIHSRPGPGGRNIRSVWTITPQPTPFAHFATFPEALVKRCILAGTSDYATGGGVCSECGKPWTRKTKTEQVAKDRASGKPWLETPSQRPDGYKPNGLASPTVGRAVTLGWQPGCTCHAPRKPAVVLDPFVGSGTSCLVARQLGRHSIGIDLSSAYLNLAIKRLEGQTLSLFAAT